MPCLWPFWRRASCGTNRHPNSSPQCARKRAAHIPTISWWAPSPPPPPPGVSGMPTQPHRTHLAMGKALSGRPTSLAGEWTEDTDTVSIIEPALDLEEHAARTLPAAPQAKFQGHTLPLRERARILRLALCTLQTLVKSGSLHPAKVIKRATSLVPLRGPPVAGLNRRPYFACRDAMHKHVQLLGSSHVYYQST